MRLKRTLLITRILWVLVFVISASAFVYGLLNRTLPLDEELAYNPLIVALFYCGGIGAAILCIFADAGFISPSEIAYDDWFEYKDNGGTWGSEAFIEGDEIDTGGRY